MSEMVEQVAIAMCNHAYLDLKVKRDWVGETRGSKDKWRAMAQAAIEAMRAPTTVMRLTGAITLKMLLPESHGSDESLPVWESMIDAAMTDVIDEALK